MKPFPPPVRRTTGSRGPTLEAERDLSGRLRRFAWEHQPRFDATTPHLQRDKTGHPEIGSASGESVSREQRAKIERDLHAVPP